MTSSEQTKWSASEAAKAWPKNGLEAVSTCPVCGGAKREVLFRRLTDRVFFCAPGEWNLFKCGQCSAAYLDPRPTAETAGLAYKRYYTHGLVEEAPKPKTALGKLRTGLKHGYLAAQHGANATPSIGFGRLLVPLLVRQRLGLDRWVRHLPVHGPDQRLLDSGCGNGKFLAVAKWLGWDAYGLDPDQAAIDAAQRGGFQVKLGQLPHTPFDDEFFDVVTLSHMIEHVPDPVLCLKEVHRILKPGGRLWVSTPNLNGYSMSRFGSDWLALDPPRHLVLFTQEALAGACASAGFSQVTPQHTLLSDYTTSLALAEGRDPWEHLDLDTGVPHGTTTRLSLAQRAEAMFATIGALVRPNMSDEIILVATKRRS